MPKLSVFTKKDKSKVTVGDFNVTLNYQYNKKTKKVSKNTDLNNVINMIKRTQRLQNTHSFQAHL